MSSYHNDQPRMVAVCNWHLYIQHRFVWYPRLVVSHVYGQLNEKKQILFETSYTIYERENLLENILLTR